MIIGTIYFTLSITNNNIKFKFYNYNRNIIESILFIKEENSEFFIEKFKKSEKDFLNKIGALEYSNKVSCIVSGKFILNYDQFDTESLNDNMIPLKLVDY